MTIKDIYERAVKRGMELDPRGPDEVAQDLKRADRELADLREKDRKWFDRERLKNPYSDTRILSGDPETEVKRVIVGIDMEVGEVVLADRIGERGGRIDLIISHHPEGRAMAALYEVMGMQAPLLLKYGVPIHFAEGVMEERINEVERKLLPANHTRAIDAARLLGIPFMCVHTPSDNAVANFLQGIFDEKKPLYVSDALDMLRDMPEYRFAANETAGPKIVTGGSGRRAGRIFVDMTGGTGGSKNVYEGLSRAGVGTIVGMHISEDHRKEAQKHHINVLIAGHIASDNLGMNLLLDDVLDAGVDVINCSGFKRITRKERG
ncbi:MAG: NGG1p interacting factor NIF3 [Deltaproteobacteria bacterium]|nr:NGG1p interacting factor NIF3 [Deltaproteobacteria bacterium]